MDWWGGPWGDETNGDCDGNLKYRMDEKYRSPENCGLNDICLMSLTQRTNESDWMEYYFELERRCTTRKELTQFGAQTKFQKSCTEPFTNFTSSLRVVHCTCDSSYCNDWVYESLRGKLNGSTFEYFANRSRYFVPPDANGSRPNPLNDPLIVVKGGYSPIPMDRGLTTTVATSTVVNFKPEIEMGNASNPQGDIGKSRAVSLSVPYSLPYFCLFILLVRVVPLLLQL
ncbi:hypothetical protein RvY_16672 [Ramazzottius varieornatus]|uniref:Uncharacterized protein n=1 Tax=Ramazzottius varieornatus TaxID=947166 RepID=A0A1D1VZC2_RAMVA|nr:hypothetical protein RvY_16672 [Ramazzottius varieornatus]